MSVRCSSETGTAALDWNRLELFVHPMIEFSVQPLHPIPQLRSRLSACFQAAVAMVVLVLASAFGHAQAQAPSCGPSRAGSTCGGAGVATLGNTSGTAQGAGNPIHLATGNKFLTEIDLPALPGPLGLELVRHYNSVHAGPAADPTALGRGWRLSYDTQLAAFGATVQVLQADGSRLVFQRDPSDPGRCASADPSKGSLQARRADDGERFDWRWPDGRVLSFDVRGYLIQVALPTGEHLVLHRDLRGQLLRVSDPQGREMRLHYARDRRGGVRLVGVDTPVGRFEFSHESATPQSETADPQRLPDATRTSLLTSVQRPNRDGSRAERRYHYEDVRFPTLLTGISESGRNGLGGELERRIATYGYDASAKARLTIRGADDGASERLILNHDSPGLTKVVDSRGRTTIAHHAIVGGEWRLLQLVGDGCSGCGPTPMSFAYDVLGRLVRETALHPDGRPLRSRLVLRDLLGRVEAVALAEHIAGRPDRVVWTERYRYDGNGPIASTAWFPSVLPGRSREVHLEFNAAGQIIRWVDIGFSPVDSDGRPLPSGPSGHVDNRSSERATRIERESRFTYRSINGRSLLHAIDGPLRNGPAQTPLDSDITRLTWDESGSRVVRIERPGREPEQLEHDAVGRLAAVVGVDGSRTRWEHDPFGRTTELASSTPASKRGSSTEAVLRWSHDVGGRLVEQVAGHLSHRAFAPSGDELGWRLDPQVREVLTAATDRMALAAARAEPEVADQFPSSGAPRLRHLVDDFGRVVARVSVDHGISTFSHDAAGRLVAMRDASGGQATYERDLRGRLVRQQLPGPNGTLSVTRWHWNGDLLMGVDHPVQDERFTYGDGRERATRVTRIHTAALDGSGPLRGGNAHAVDTVTQWCHDAAGRLLASSLPDGSWLNWRRDQTGQVVSLERERLATPWLQFLLPTQVLASGIRGDGFGLSSLEFGNGLEGRWVRSKRGELARVLHAPADRESRPGASVAALERPRMPASSTPSWTGSSVEWVVASLASPLTSRDSGLNPNDRGVTGESPGWLFRPGHPDSIVDDRLGFDSGGNLVLREERGSGRDRRWHHRYDSADRLLATWSERPLSGSADLGDEVRFYAYDADGNRVRSRVASANEASHATAIETQPGSHRIQRIDGTEIRHDETGRPIQLGDLRFEWDSSGRPVEIRGLAAGAQGAPLRTLAKFGYNHRGERVLRADSEGSVKVQVHDQRRRLADLDPDGRITRQWIWLGDLPLAVIDASPTQGLKPLASVSALSKLLRDLQYLASHLRGVRDRVTYLHTNHLGAPVAATDERGRPRWHAEYADFGRATVRSVDGFELDLRLPGQHEDPETRLHHNDHRVYDPDLGRYLTPDPLGAPDGPNPYVYVRNNPLRYVDPTGLVLWAFDGTANSPDSRTNVWHLAQAYQDHSAFDRAHGITGMTHYVIGPGTVVHADGTYSTGWTDSAFAGSMNGTLATEMERLRSYVRANWGWAGHRDPWLGESGRPLRITLDVTGFSRGAALAREFSNRVRDFEQSAEFRGLYGDCLDIVQRMLALFDTVLASNLAALGPNPLRMAIPPEVEWVFHAVALNERRAPFPLESIHQSPDQLLVPNLHRVERGFIGAHSDVGGGYSGIGPGMTGGDLSDLALMWMIRLAERDAQVSFGELPAHLHQVSSPIVHDPRRETTWTVLGSRWSSSREVRFRSPAAQVLGPAEPPVSPDPDSARVSSPSSGERVIEIDQRRLTWPRGMGQTAADQVLQERPEVAWFGVDSRELDRQALCDYVQWLREHYDATVPIQEGCR